MKVRMRTVAASPEGVLQAGVVYDLDATTAQPLIDGGYAENLAADRPAKGGAKPKQPAQKAADGGETPTGGEGEQ